MHARDLEHQSHLTADDCFVDSGGFRIEEGSSTLGRRAATISPPTGSRRTTLLASFLNSSQCLGIRRAGNGTRTRDFNLGKVAGGLDIIEESRDSRDLGASERCPALHSASQRFPDRPASVGDPPPAL